MSASAAGMTICMRAFALCMYSYYPLQAIE
jgi:hypothetical protein